MIEKLIEMGADINAKDSDERTALHIAVAHNDPEVVELLLSKGAAVDALNKKKESAILLAIRRVPCLGYVDALVRYGADMNVKDAEGRSALHLALIKKY